MATAMHWQGVVAYGRAVLAGLPATQRLDVRYEDLVTDPTPALEQICRGVGVTFDPRMLDPQMRRQEQAFKESRGQVHALLTEPLQKERAEGWRELPAWAIGLVERICAAGMRDCGYAPAATRSAPGLQAVGAGLWWMRRRAIRREWWRTLRDLGVDRGLEAYL